MIQSRRRNGGGGGEGEKVVMDIMVLFSDSERLYKISLILLGLVNKISLCWPGMR